jgi:hypothetical protein
MRSRVCSILLLTAGALGGFIGAATANGPCMHCGHHGSCNKVCRLKYEEKKVEVVCWGMKCEDFCVNGCSTKCAKHCESVCDECEGVDPYKEPSTGPKKFVWSEWTPKHCAKMYTKSKLMKKTITKKIPTYKWVVEDLCAQCEANAKAKDAQVVPGATIPPKPTTTQATFPGPPAGMAAHPQTTGR